MTIEEKKLIYLNRFPAIISRRLMEQLNYHYIKDYLSLLRPSKNFNELDCASLIICFNSWSFTIEKHSFWIDIFDLYCSNEDIYHQQLLDIFHKHGIKP
jgi:hypothetical protein